MLGKGRSNYLTPILIDNYGALREKGKTIIAEVVWMRNAGYGWGGAQLC